MSKTVASWFVQALPECNVIIIVYDVVIIMSKKEESLFAMVKPSDSNRTLDQLAEDVFTLAQRFAFVSAVHDMNTFKVLIRLFKEQCVLEEENESSESKAVARPNKDVPSDSLQKPFDTDAGYSNHKGQGYQVQVVENYSEGDNDKQRSFLTHITVESADQHDANALLPAITDLQERDMAPEELLADFVLDDQGRIISYPKGIDPDQVKKTKRGFSAAFSSATCLECDSFKQCPVSKGKKDIRLARRRQHEKNSAFKGKYRYRAGVEATMSEYDRRTGVKHLRVRGMKAVRFAAIMKAMGLNIFRASRHRRRKNHQITPQGGICLTCLSFCSYVKEQISRQIQIAVVFLAILLSIFKIDRKCNFRFLQPCHY